MQSKSLLALCIFAMLALAVVGESAVASLKEKVETNQGAAPCDKATPAAGPAPPRQFLDVRLPVVVDDYHPPVGGFNPSDIPSKEVDVAARLILREIQAAEAEAKANGDEPQKQSQDGILTTEEHKALKQLLLDSDILVRAAAKSLSENGPIEAATAKKVASSAIAKAAKLEKKSKKHASAPINKLAAAATAAATPAATTPAAATPAAGAPAVVGAVAPKVSVESKKASKRALPQVGAVAKTAASTESAKAAKRS